MDQIQLIENVDQQIIKIRTRSLDVSFNELYDMFSDGELIINPAYQRLFRWSEEKQSRFIESLILEMPVPPIFVIEVENGVYELIDGLQRISSYLHFRGASLDIGESSVSTPLNIYGCDIVPELNGLDYNSLPKPLQIKLKRSFVRMEVIKKESEPSLKYHMFKRLNDGGENLSDQEIRNCTVRLLGSEAIDFISKCAKNKDFKEVTSKIKEKEINEKFDDEIILRFFALKNDLENYRYPLADFLTSYLEKITIDKSLFNYDDEELIFNKTFKIIRKSLGKNSFSSILANSNYKENFILYYYDAITIAISIYSDCIEENHYSEIKRIFESIKNGEHIKSYKTGTLSNSKARIELFRKGVEGIIGVN